MERPTTRPKQAQAVTHEQASGRDFAGRRCCGREGNRFQALIRNPGQPAMGWGAENKLGAAGQEFQLLHFELGF